MVNCKHRNEETVVKCPVEECNHEGLSRGINLHVRQSSGDGHGPHGDVPDNLDFDNLTAVGEETVEYDYPEEREVENVARLCPFCGQAFNGFQGVKVHVGQKQGQGVHPEDATEVEKDDCPIAEVDDDMNVIEVVEERSLMPSTKRRITKENNSISEDKVLKFIEELKKEDEDEFAERVESSLLS